MCIYCSLIVVFGVMEGRVGQSQARGSRYTREMCLYILSFLNKSPIIRFIGLMAQWQGA
jgi:hypothetical protein